MNNVFSESLWICDLCEIKTHTNLLNDINNSVIGFPRNSHGIMILVNTGGIIVMYTLAINIQL